MFTGIVGAIGEVLAPPENGMLVIRTSYDDVAVGESIAVNGACLTAIQAPNAGRLFFSVSPETLERTSLGESRAGDPVNLERALRFSDRLSGHLVQGHVDGRGRLARITSLGECHEIEVELPARMMRYTIEKGSIALDGVSLTVNALQDNVIRLLLVPHTWENTTFSRYKAPRDLNVELDMIAKYVESLTK